MNIRELYYKGKDKIRYLIYNRNFHKKWYPYLYSSYWHMRRKHNMPEKLYDNYFAARPNPGAGIGHQIANWIAGYWFAEQFGLKFAHIPFSNSRIPYTQSSWEPFLNFGSREITVEELKKKQGYKIVRLPMFGERIEKDLSMIYSIIRSYEDQKVVFLAEQDQFYQEQYGVMNVIQQKFSQALVERERLIYEEDDGVHIAVHIRRGDVVWNSSNPNIQMRWLDTDYYCRVLKEILSGLEKETHIYIFSQGSKEQFEPYFKFPNVHYCLDMTAQNTFWHLTQADILLISKSSFSYKPALLSQRIVVAPQHFWHGYPNLDRWIIVNEEGEIEKNAFCNLQNMISFLKSEKEENENNC